MKEIYFMRHPVFVFLLLSMNFFLCFSVQNRLPRYLFLATRGSSVSPQAINRLPWYTMSSRLLPHEVHGIPEAQKQKVERIIFQQNFNHAKAVSEEFPVIIDPSKFLSVVE